MNYMDFRKKLATDRDFAAKFNDCATVEALVKAAVREGYSFTAEEVRNNTEILPEELATVAGGVSIAKNAFGGGPAIARGLDWG